MKHIFSLLFIIMLLVMPVCAAENFVAAGLTLTETPALRPAFTYAHQLTKPDSGPSLYSISDYTIVGMSRKPLSLQIVSLTGIGTPVMAVGRGKFRATIWGVSQIGLARAPNTSGLAYSPIGTFATIPIRDWLVIVPGVKPIKSALSDWQAEYRLSLAWGW
jgi:hypothetical protein